MPIALDLFADKLKVKPLRGPNFKEHRDKAKSLRNKQPRHTLNYETGDYTFDFWEVPRSEIGNILSMFTVSDIVFESDEIRKVVETYLDLMTPLTELPKITKQMEWLRPPLYPECDEYIRISERRPRLICAFEPGLTKSATSLMRAQILGYKRILIVCPNCLIDNWESEVHMTLGKPVTFYVGTPKQRAKIDLSGEIIVTTYGMVKELNDLKADQLILDEVQVLANPHSKRTKAATKFVRSKPDAGVQLLSGTPVLHKPENLWPLVNILYPELAGSYEDWKTRYTRVDKSIIKEIYVRDASGQVMMDADGFPKSYRITIPTVVTAINLDELHERSKSHMFVCKREGKVGFQESIELIKVAMKGRQKSLYQSIGKEVILQLQDRNLPVPTQLAAITRLLQVSEAAFNLEPEWKDSGKLDYVKEMGKEIDDKLLICSRFKRMTYEVRDAFPKEAVIFNGDMSRKQKFLAIVSFNGAANDLQRDRFYKLLKTTKWPFEPGEARIMAMVIDRYTSLGFNLPACHRKICTSWTWNGNVNNQAFDRTRRPGQLAPVDYTEYILSGPIDEYALKMVFANLKVTNHIVHGKDDMSYTLVQELIEEVKRVFA